MNATIRGHKIGATVAIILIAVTVLLTVALVYMLRPLPTTGHGEATPVHRDQYRR